MALELNKQAFIILGLGFGDEGKGLATDYLCRVSPVPLVIRFNGGHQAGHTVVTSEGFSHIFSTFGAGTLRGVPTYWSKYCTFSASILLSEFNNLPVKPKLYVDELCPVTTHYDVLYNRALESSRGEKRYGSCGLGFGATVERHTIESLKFCFRDLFSASSIKKYLSKIRDYYRYKLEGETHYIFDDFNHNEADLKFQEEALQINKLIKDGIIEPANEQDIFSNKSAWQTLIFEGAQGILLDKNYGFKPHITKSNTTSRNALELLRIRFPELIEHTKIMYTTRCYLTRHGAGPIPQLDKKLVLTHQRDETNSYNVHQGEFRIAPLDIDLLNYAIRCDSNFSKDIKKWLLITCLDQLEADNITVSSKGEAVSTTYSEIPKLIDSVFENYLFSFNSCADYLP